MARFVPLLLAGMLVCNVGRAQAQDAPPNPPAGPESSLVSMLSSPTEVYRAIDAIMGLTGSVDQQQAQVIKNYLDGFLIGMNRDKPLRMDALVDEKPYRYRLAFPVPPDRLDDYRHKNLIPLGIDNRRISQTMYRLGPAPGRAVVFEGWLRYDDQHAWIAEEQNDLGQPPDYMPPPILALRTLLGKNYLLGGELVNQPTGAEKRHQFFNQPQGIRDEWMSQLTPAKDETPSDFKLRKLRTEHRLDELEQFISEGRHGLVGARLDLDAKEMQVDLSLTPIAGTPLGDAVQKIGRQPSAFAGVPRHKDPVLSGRINLPLDELRKENLQETLALHRQRSLADIDARTTPMQTAQQKQRTKEAVNILFDMLAETAEAGLLDAFAEIWAGDAGTHTLVFGMHAADGTKVLDALKLLPEAYGRDDFEFGFETVGDVALHSLPLSPERHAVYGDFFGTFQAYVGTSDDSVWFAIGENALDELKTAIEQAAEGDATPAEGSVPFVALNAQPGPLLDLMPAPAAEGMPESPYRAIARQAFEPGDDRVVVELERLGDAVRGFVHASPGVLRFLGKAAAEFSRENLDEEGRRRPREQANR